MVVLDFTDKQVPYDVFMADLSARVAERLAAIQQEPDVVSQREAYRRFGRANVERWLKQGKLHPAKRVGKMEYKTSELRKMRDTKQDYFK